MFKHPGKLKWTNTELQKILNSNFNVMMMFLFLCNVHVMCDASVMLVNFLCLSN